MTNVLEPPPLADLAAHVRDQDWLDMRVCENGTVQRVVINQLNIGRERDEVVVRQKYLCQHKEADASEYKPEIRSETYTFDAEDIIWVRGTQVALDEVRPHRKPQETIDLMPHIGNDLAKRVIDEIIRTMVFVSGLAGITEGALRKPKGRDDKALRARQEAMWLAYEMTDLSPTDICCQHFGYRSQQPVLTISDKIRFSKNHEGKIHYNEQPGEWVKRVKHKAALLDAKFGTKLRRKTDSPGWPTIL